MKRLTDRGVKMMLREQYESLVYRTLIETELKGENIMNARGLEVTRKRDSEHGMKGEKMTIQSVEQRGGQVIVHLVSPENVSPPNVPQPAGMNHPTQEYTLEQFESNFEV